MAEDRVIFAIDMKSFYASVECHARHMDPLRTHLVVADETRTDKTICLAVSPALKAYGISGRARLYEVRQAVQQINRDRLAKAVRARALMKRDGEYRLEGASFDADCIARDASMALGFIIAPPRMRLYMEVSNRIYNIYLKWFAPEDIHVYSIDECFIDATAYMQMYEMTPRQLAMTLMRQVKAKTGITSTGGIGTNLYLAKVAMDIVAKHIPADADGVRIAELDEMSYRRQLWDHQPLTDFWRIGPGIARKLESRQLYTMGDIARASVSDIWTIPNEATLHKMFGVNAELIIDHAWGVEPATMADIKAYKPKANSVSQGQVLHRPYTYAETKLIVEEMAEQLAQELTRRNQVSGFFTLWVGYDPASLEGGIRYQGQLTVNHYGHPVPVPTGGSVRQTPATDSPKIIMALMKQLFEETADELLLYRHLNLCAAELKDRSSALPQTEQIDMFTDWQAAEEKRQAEEQALKREHDLQRSILTLQDRFGKNAVFRAMNLEEAGTALERNNQVGGHKA